MLFKTIYAKKINPFCMFFPVSNALLVKLLAYDLSDQQSDLDDASALLTHILEINAIDLSFGGLFAAPLLMGGLGAPLPASLLKLHSTVSFQPLHQQSPRMSATQIYFL
jgi:hypothetical protein